MFSPQASQVMNSAAQDGPRFYGGRFLDIPFRREGEDTTSGRGTGGVVVVMECPVRSLFQSGGMSMG